MHVSMPSTGRSHDVLYVCGCISWRLASGYSGSRDDASVATAIRFLRTKSRNPVSRWKELVSH